MSPSIDSSVNSKAGTNWAIDRTIPSRRRSTRSQNQPPSGPTTRFGAAATAASRADEERRVRLPEHEVAGGHRLHPTASTGEHPRHEEPPKARVSQWRLTHSRRG